MSLTKLHLQNATNASCPDLRGQGYSACFDSHSVARGPRKKIYHGHLNGKGPRKGEDEVIKVFRDKPGTEAHCDEEIEKHKLARQLAARFNKLIADERSQIHFTLPLKSTVDSVGLRTYLARHSIRALDKKEWVLMEQNLLPLGTYQVFIRKDGERLSKEPTSLDAFMHFTYHESEGLFLMCGFQGVHTSTGYTLTTPCFHSVENSFGYTIDKGYRGIKTAFKQHQCNNICYSFLRFDPAKMPEISSESETDEKEGREQKDAHAKTAVSKTSGSKEHRDEVVSEHHKFSRTKKMINTDNLDIPTDEGAPCALPKADTDPDVNVDIHFQKDSSPIQSLAEMKKDKKKKRKSHRSNVKMLTSILKKRPSF